MPVSLFNKSFYNNSIGNFRKNKKQNCISTIGLISTRISRYISLKFSAEQHKAPRPLFVIEVIELLSNAKLCSLATPPSAAQQLSARCARA